MTNDVECVNGERGVAWRAARLTLCKALENQVRLQLLPEDEVSVPSCTCTHLPLRSDPEVCSIDEQCRYYDSYAHVYMHVCFVLVGLMSVPLRVQADITMFMHV